MVNTHVERTIQERVNDLRRKEAAITLYIDGLTDDIEGQRKHLALVKEEMEELESFLKTPPLQKL